MKVTLPAPSRVDGRTIVITGASSGIGRAAARELSGLGGEVVVVGRDPERTAQVADEVGGRSYLVDMTSLASVRELAGRLLADVPHIHVLANNAGGINQVRRVTADGFEETFQQNHLGGFLLTSLLLDRLRSTAADAPEGAVRVIQTSSLGNVGQRVRLDDLDSERGPWLGGFRAYGRSKLANILFTRQLAVQLAGSGVGAYAFHPGLVATNFGGDQAMSGIVGPFAISPEQGAMPLVRLAAAAEVPAPSGNYFHRLVAPGRTARQANDMSAARALWRASEERAGLR